MEKSKPQIPEPNFINPEQLHGDTTTWLAEVLDGQMRTTFEYSFDGRELYGQDGRPLSPIFKDAIIDAENIATTNPNLVFELRRRQIELDEYQDMIKMANGELPNTMVVISDFPAELMDAKKDVGGYNVNRKQTMMRVITRDEQGKLNIISQSLDRSDRTGLEAIYDSLGFKTVPGELLSQRMHLDLPKEEREFLPDWLTGTYDRALAAQWGGEWYAGRTPGERLNTYDFVCAQQDLLEAFSAETYLAGEANETILYSLAAAMHERFKNPLVANETINNWRQAGFSLDSTYVEMEQAASRARIRNETFSGCGLSLGDTQRTDQELGKSGYGNKTDEETAYKFDKKMYCVVCQTPPQKGDSKKMCGPCGICKICDTKLKK